jgi:DNA-binding NarL/FixJ family response regulator
VPLSGASPEPAHVAGNQANLGEATMGERTCSSTSSAEGPGAKSRVARILIIDSHPIVREGLRRIIEKEPDLAVCAEADSMRDARTAIARSSPDVIIADISLKQGDGIDLVRDVRANYPLLPLLVLSIYDETIYAERMLSVGASGYLTKQATGAEILLSLRRIIAGGIYVSEAVGNNMIKRTCAGAKHAPADPVARLSTRELQVLHLTGKGMTTRETAHSLNLSVKTIESHRQRIKSKLNLRNSTQLLQYAINVFVGEDAGKGLRV